MKTRHSKYSFALAHPEVRTKPFVFCIFPQACIHNKPRSVLNKDCLSMVWLCRCGPNCRPADCIWPATAFSVARGSIQKKLQIWNLLKSVWGYICFTELLALDKVHLYKNNEYYFFCVPLLFLFYLFYDQIRRYGPPLTLSWGNWLYNLCVFSLPRRSLSWRVHLTLNNTAKWVCLYQSAKRDLFKVAIEPNLLPIPAIRKFNYCTVEKRTSITSFIKNVGSNTDGIRDCKEVLEISLQK